MSTRYQLSDKRGDAILLVTTEGSEPQLVEAEFAEAVALLGLAPALSAFEKTQAAAVANVHQVFPGAQVQQAQEPWGNPPVPPMPSAATPSCQHGQKVYKTGTKDGREWKAWACPGASTDPTRCKFVFIRD